MIPSDIIINNCIENGVNGAGNTAAQVFAKDLNSRGLKTTQIRKTFGKIKLIQNDFAKKRNEIIMLLPQLAYDAARKENASERDAAKAYYDYFKIALAPIITQLDLVDDMAKTADERKTAEAEAKKLYNNFVRFTEAIVAYHKAAEEKILV